MKFVVVIPARYQSSRLPGKPLADIAGKPMIQWVYEQSVSSGADRVVVATDDERIKLVVEGFGGEVCMTSASHESGTERLAEVVDQLDLEDTQIVVNVQGDEPLIPPAVIHQVASNLASNNVPMATLSVDIDDVEEAFNPNAVKVVTDSSGNALYFSRATIPWDRDQFADSPSELRQSLSRHIGIYAYRAAFIKRYVSWQPSPLEKIESLEQLRVLWYGERIHVARAVEAPPAGVDTPDDLEAVRNLLTKSA